MGLLYPALVLLLAGNLAVAQSTAHDRSGRSVPATSPPKHVCTDLGQTEFVPCPGETQPSGGAATSSVAPSAPTAQPRAAVPPQAAPTNSKAKENLEYPSPAAEATTSRNSEAAHLLAEAPPDVNLSAVGDGPGFHAALRDLPLNLLQDQRNFFTSPLRTRTTDLNLLVPFAGITAVLAAGVDRGIESHLPSSASAISRSKSISNYGAAAMGAGVAGTWLLGHARHDDHMTEAGFLSGEAAISTLAIAELGKYAFGRQRPLVGDGKGSFFSGGDSFPSLHVAAAFSIATIMSEEYPGPFMKFLAYGAAGTIAATRVTARQHFASDALVGAGLGWFLGRQVYRAHHENDGDLKRWGTFERAAGDRPKDSSLGSPYVPLDSWVYPAFDRLSAMGVVRGGFAGMRPWTRRQCAELLEGAAAEMEQAPPSSSVARTYAALEQEFAPELSGNTRPSASIESIYTRVTAISGTPLTDGYHFGQTIINDYGRPYQHGFNNVTGVSGYATAGPLTFYMRGEYQHAPAATVLPLAARQAIGQADFLPAPPAIATAEQNQLTLLDSYVGLNLSDWQFTFGKQSLWWGPGEGGPMMFSDNAAPITMIRMNRVQATKLPSIFGWLGPFRTEAFMGRLSGYEFIDSPSGMVGQWGQSLRDQPFIHGQRISFQPTENFEFGFSRTTIFGGSGYPVTSSSFWRSLTSTGNTFAGNPSKPGDRRSGLDFSYRIPKLRNWLTFYGDGFTEDEYSPVAYWDRSVWHAGVFMPKIPAISNLDLRVEGVYSDNPLGGNLPPGYFYSNGTWRDGYRSSGNLLGSWIGRAGQGGQVFATYHFSSQQQVKVNFRHQKVSSEFLPGGGTITDLGMGLNLWRLSHASFLVSLDYEAWKYPVLTSARQAAVVTSFEVILRPGIH